MTAAENRAQTLRKALRCAFPYTIPILAGYLFMGITHGIIMNVSGFSFVYPMIMSLTVFGGAMQFAAVSLLTRAFDPLSALVLTVMINARYLFYGVSMLERYRAAGPKGVYLVYGTVDETFSINYTAAVPEDVDRGWFMFFVTLLDHLYWIAGCTLGGIFGSLISFNTEGLDFVMTAMFLVIFLEQWCKEKNHTCELTGLLLSLLCRVVFGAERFLLPAMLAILAALTLLRRPLEAGGDAP